MFTDTRSKPLLILTEEICFDSPMDPGDHDVTPTCICWASPKLLLHTPAPRLEIDPCTPWLHMYAFSTKTSVL